VEFIILSLHLSDTSLALIGQILRGYKKYEFRIENCSTVEELNTILFSKEWNVLFIESSEEKEKIFASEFKESEVFSHIPIISIENSKNSEEFLSIADFIVENSEKNTTLPIILESVLKYSHTIKKFMQQNLTIKEKLINNYILLEIVSSYLSENTLTAAKRQAQDQNLLPEPDMQNRTILFLDICGFTDYSSSHETQKIILLLDTLYSLIVPILREYKGDIDKFIGDGCLVVFEKPRMAMQAVLHIYQIIKNTSSPILADVALHAGIHTGNVIRCRIGGEHRYDYTLIGSAVNVASKLQALAGPYEVFVSKDSLEAAGMSIPFELHNEAKLGTTNRNIAYIELFSFYAQKFSKSSIEKKLAQPKDIT